MHEIFKYAIIQHQLRTHHRLAGDAQFLALGGAKPERHFEAIGQTAQHDGVDDAHAEFGSGQAKASRQSSLLTTPTAC